MQHVMLDFSGDFKGAPVPPVAANIALRIGRREGSWTIRAPISSDNTYTEDRGRHASSGYPPSFPARRMAAPYAKKWLATVTQHEAHGEHKDRLADPSENQPRLCPVEVAKPRIGPNLDVMPWVIRCITAENTLQSTSCHLVAPTHHTFIAVCLPLARWHDSSPSQFYG